MFDACPALGPCPAHALGPSPAHTHTLALGPALGPATAHTLGTATAHTLAQTHALGPTLGTATAHTLAQTHALGPPLGPATAHTHALGPATAHTHTLATAYAPAREPRPGTLLARPRSSPREPSRTRALIEAIQQQLPEARVVITDNRTVLLSQSSKEGQHTVRVHQMFLDAPVAVRDAVAHYLAKGDRRSGDKVDAFIEAQGHLLQMTAKPLANDAHVGRVHNLLPLFLALNDRYFSGVVEAELGWSQAGAPCRKKRRSITFGSWDTRARRIVIHPVLDQRDVPRVCVERVLHHEMVHAKVGEERGAAGQRIVHGRRFAAQEALFHGAHEADKWFEKHLDALLHWRPGVSLHAAASAKRRS